MDQPNHKQQSQSESDRGSGSPTASGARSLHPGARAAPGADIDPRRNPRNRRVTGVRRRRRAGACRIRGKNEASKTGPGHFDAFHGNLMDVGVHAGCGVFVSAAGYTVDNLPPNIQAVSDQLVRQKMAAGRRLLVTPPTCAAHQKYAESAQISAKLRIQFWLVIELGFVAQKVL